MKSVLTLVAVLLAVIQFPTHTQAQCTSPTYTEQLTLNCAADIGLSLPNYQNNQQYWICIFGSPVLENCPSNTPYFSYAMQACTTCGGYIPAVPCAQLPAPGKQCSAIGGGNPTDAPGAPSGPTYPSPLYPSSTTSRTTTTRTTTTKAPKDTTITPTTGLTTVAGPPIETVGPGGTTIYIPGPPSPQTNNPNMATPPTPLPTPPVIVDQPPQVSDPPVQPKLN